MKFETKTRAERQTQPDIMPDDDIDFEIQNRSSRTREITDVSTEHTDAQDQLKKLKKSLYGLKQSGRNWDNVLHEYLRENKFVQNPLTTVFT